MDLQSILFRMGIPTWVEDIPTTLGAVGQSTVQIGNQMPTNVGFIYGLATYADGVDSENNVLITTVQSQNLFITLQDGPTQFYQKVRMSDLLNEFAGTPVVRSEKFTPVCIPSFDLSKSFYQNPTLITNATIRLKLYYVQMNVWNKVKKNFTLSDNT